MIPRKPKHSSPQIALIREPDKPKMPAIEVPDAGMTVEEISLMRSERGKNGMIYTELGAVKCIF